MLLDALRSAEPIGLQLDRNLQVLLPSQAAKQTNLPQDFFKLTPEELKREQQLKYVFSIIYLFHRLLLTLYFAYLRISLS